MTKTLKHQHFFFIFDQRKKKKYTKKSIKFKKYIYKKYIKIFLHKEEEQYILDNNLTILIDDIIQTDLSSFLLWNNGTKIIRNKLLETINAFSLFKDFRDFFLLNEKEAVSLLNQCYIYEPNINIPILDGRMVNYESRYKSDGIDQNFIEFITATNANDSILQELAWPEINHPKLKQYESSNIILKIHRATNKICQDDKLREDPKIKRIINIINSNAMNEFNILSYNTLSEVDKEKLLIFSKIFISNLGPRLRELENPSEIIKERWAWELIQNAKDTIVSEPDRKVNIKFSYDKKHLIFQHDGNYFTLKQYLAMVYKFSEDKHDQNGNTGRFGTGFLTTHIISPKVTLRSNLINNNVLKGFEVILDRSGHKDYELEESMKRTEESKKIFKKTFDCTSFEYQYNDQEHINRVKKGIQNLKKNLPLVLLFCRNINSVVIENLDENEKLEFLLEPNKKQNINNVKIIKNDTDVKIRKFIFFHAEKESQNVANLYERTNKLIEVNTALEIDSDDKIICNNNTESLYCVFPLIGSKISLPFIINSPDFETTTERDSIFLKDSSEDKSTVDKINYEILGIGLELYQNIIEYCIQKKISCLYYLAYGLNKIIAESEHINPNTFSKSFLTKAQNILCSHPVFLTTNGYKCINEASLINYSFPIKETKLEKYKKDFYNLFSLIYINPIDFEESKHWCSFLWSSIKSFKHSDLLNKVSQFNSISNIQFTKKNKFITPNESLQIKFINDVIDFVLEFDKVQLQEIKLIPNQNKIFCNDDSNLYFANEVTEDAIDLIHKLGGEWKQNHVFRGIKEKDYLPCHKIQDAESIIKKNINEKNSLLMMEYIIPNNQERIKMHEYSHLLLGTSHKAIKLPGFSNDMWSNCDMFVIHQFILKIQDTKRISKPIESVAWLSDLILFCMKKGMNVINIMEYSIFPNQNNTFMPFKSIFKDKIKHEEIKNAINNYCNVDIKNELLHLNFGADLGFEPKYLNNYYKLINQLYKNGGFDDYQFSLILVKYLTDDISINAKQIDLIKSINILCEQNLNGIELKSSMVDSTFKYVSRSISKYINYQLSGKTIKDLTTTNKKSLNEIIMSLNIIYKFSENTAYVPNLNNIFRECNQLKVVSYDEKLPQIIHFQISISEIINPNVSFTNSLVMKGIQCHLIKNILDLQSACTNIDNLISDKYKNILKSNKNDLKCILNDLINFITANNIWENFPNLKQKCDSLISKFIVSKDDRDLVLKIKNLPENTYRQLIDFVNNGDKRVFLSKFNSLSESDQQYLMNHTDSFRQFIQNQRTHEERQRQRLLRAQQSRAENQRRNHEASNMNSNRPRHERENVRRNNETLHMNHNRLFQQAPIIPPPPPPRPFIERVNTALESFLRNMFKRVSLNKELSLFDCSLIDDDESEVYSIITLFMDQKEEIDLNEHIVEIISNFQETAIIFIIPSNNFSQKTLNKTIKVIPNISDDINGLNIVESICDIVSIDDDDFAFRGCDKYYLHVKKNYIENHSIIFNEWKNSFLSQTKK